MHTVSPHTQHLTPAPQPLPEFFLPSQEKLDHRLFLATFSSLWEEEGAPRSRLPGNYLPLVWGMPKAWLQAVGEQRRSRKSSLQQLPGGTRLVHTWKLGCQDQPSAFLCLLANSLHTEKVGFRS